MEKLTLVKRDTTDREGNALTTRDGRPYTRMSIKVESKGDKYVSGFGSKDNSDWKVGDEVDILIVESDKTDKNGQPYLNFSITKKEDKVDEKLEQILNKLTGIGINLEVVLGKLSAKKQDDYSDEPDPDGIPF